MAVKRRRPSGSSGENLVPSRKLRVPDELWERFARVVEDEGRTRNAVLNELIEAYCAPRCDSRSRRARLPCPSFTVPAVLLGT